MQDLQNCKFVNVTPPGAIIDNAAVVTGSVDTKGWRKAVFIVALGALDIAVAVMKLREADDDSTYSDVTGADFSVSPLTLPAATADNNLYGIFVDLRGRKRYLDLSLTAGDGAAGSYVQVTAILYEGEAFPNTAAKRGLAQQAIV